jgi:AlwI restriction endonuclease
MAQARTRLWFLPTSPRSPDKIRRELALLQDFDGQTWDKDAQAEFFRRIVNSGTYESAGRPPKEPDQPGRERVHRAPRSLGLVRAMTGSTLEITNAGHALIDGHDPADLFLHQLLKLQFPSPNHDNQDYRELFWIKPFLEVLRLVGEVESISKFELQAFGLALIDHRDFEAVVADVRGFREARGRVEPGRPRRQFEQDALFSRMGQVYSEDLATTGISLRERRGRAVAPQDVLATKVANARDYADAAMRYFYRTGLFTFSDFRSLRLLPERGPDVARILTTVSADPEPFEGSDLDSFWAYLGDPNLPQLALDEPSVVKERFEVLRDEVSPSVLEAVGALPEPSTATVPELKFAYTRLQERAEVDVRERLRAELAHKDMTEELVSVFAQIMGGGLIERSLVLEWNVWRLLAVLDDGDIRNNFKLDRFGQPVTHAPGNVSDIECTYEDFHLLTEVTVAYGARQHATEGEPVTRHVGLYQRHAQNQNDRRPVFGLFIAERLEPTVIADFYSAFTTKVRAFGGALKIIPLEISDVVALIEQTRDRLSVISARDLRRFLDRASLLVTESMDEEEWRERVKALARVGI